MKKNQIPAAVGALLLIVGLVLVFVTRGPLWRKMPVPGTKCYLLSA